MSNVAKKLTLEKCVVGYSPESPLVRLEGEFTGGDVNLVLGRGGVGKSTLLRTLAGLVPRLEGSVTFDGRAWEPRGNATLVFQNPEALFFNLTVGEEISFSLQEKGFPAAEAEKRGREWLEKWGLDPDQVWGRSPFDLSGGEKRMVGLAACTVLSPDVILLDEPMAGLDQTSRHSLVEIIRTLAREKLLVLVTHDPEPFFRFTRTVLFLDHGEGTWFDSARAFLFAAYHARIDFPLADWYQAALDQSPPSIDSIPFPEVGDLMNYLRK